MSASTEQIDDILKKGYDAGFITDIEQEYAPPGLSEEIVAFISKKKQEPEWLLRWRLKAYRRWQQMSEPRWAKDQMIVAGSTLAPEIIATTRDPEPG